MGEDQHNYRSPSTSFIDTELEDSPMSPSESQVRAEESTNSYRTAAILPTPRDNFQRGVPVNRPAATYLPNFVANARDFQMPQPSVFNNYHQTIYPCNYNQREIIISTNMNPPAADSVVVYNNAPSTIQIPPNGGRMVMPQQAPVVNNQQVPTSFSMWDTALICCLSQPVKDAQKDAQFVPHCDAKCGGLLRLMPKMLRPNSTGNLGRVPDSNRVRRRDSEIPRCKIPCIH